MANINISQILLKRGNTASAGAYVGPLGEVVIDTGLKSLRLQDGATPGGMSTLATQGDLSNVASAIAGISSLGNISQLLANLQGTNTAAITSNVSTLFSNAVAQAGLINTINANIIAVNAAIITANTTQSTQITSLQSQIAGANAAIITANTAMKGYVDTQVTNLTANDAIQSSQIAGANAAIITANTALKSYVDSVTTAWTANAAAQAGDIATLYANAVTQLSQITAANTSISALQANLGATQIWANANIASITANLGSYYVWANANVAGLYNSILGANANAVAQQSAINSTTANIGSFYTWANANFSTSSYANANVAAYLVANPQAGTYSNTNTSAYLASQNITSANIGSLRTDVNSLVTNANANVAAYLAAGVSGNIVTTANIVTSLITTAAGTGANLTIDPDGNADVIINAANVWLNAGHLRSTASSFLLANVYPTSANLFGNATAIYMGSSTGNVISRGGFTGTGFFYANGVNILTTVTPSSTYSNANVTSYLPTHAGNVQASTLLVSTSIISTGSSPAPVMSGFSSISTTGSAVNEGNITASGNLVASRGAFITGNITTAANVIAPNYLFANGVNILSTVTGSYGNANVVANLANFVTNISTTGNVTAGNVLGTYYGNAIGTTSTYTGNVTAGNVLGTHYGNAIGTTSTYTGNVTAGGNVFQQGQYYETYSNVSNTGGNLTCAMNNGSVFYVTLGANVTANFTNVNAISSTVTGATIIVDQGATAYRVANVQVNGVTQTVKWVGASAGNGTASNTDVMSFSLINLGSGNYRVLGQISNYG